MAGNKIVKTPDEDHTGESAENGGGGKKKLIIIIVAVLLLALGGGGFAGYKLGWFGGGATEEESSAKEEKSDKKDAKKEKDGAHGSKEKGAKGKEGHGDKKGESKEGKHGAEGEAAPEGPAFYNLPEFLVNLNTGGKQSSFLKMRISLELAGAEDTATIEANLPRIQDALNTYIRELRPSDLSGSAGIYRLKEEVMLRVNKTLAPVKVRDILFNEILVQ